MFYAIKHMLQILVFQTVEELNTENQNLELPNLS
jgi:hypothetical protein